MAKKQKVKRPSDKPPLQVSYPAVVGVIFWLLFVVGVWQAGRMIYRSNAFSITKVVVPRNIQIGPQLIRGIKGTPLFSLDTNALRSRILASDSDFRDASVEKRFPSTLVIKIDKRKAFVQLKYNGHYTIDRDGVVIDSDSSADVNLLAVEVADCPVAPIKGAVVNSLQLDIARVLIDEMKRRKFFVRYAVELINTSTPESAYFVIRNKNSVDGGVQVIIGSDDFNHKLFIFDNLMATKVKGDMQLVKYIDLRYKKAYVGYKR